MKFLPEFARSCSRVTLAIGFALSIGASQFQAFAQKAPPPPMQGLAVPAALPPEQLQQLVAPIAQSRRFLRLLKFIRRHTEH